jgi:hypothetical protein
MTLKYTWANGEQFTATDANDVATAVNAAYTKPGTGIPSTDLASAVQTSLGKADSAVQAVSSTSITDATTTGKAVLTATDSATARTTLGVAYGTTSGTVAQGNDSRFTPASTSISDATTTGRALLTTTDASTARTTLGVAYGTSSGTVAQGNDSRITGAEQTSAKNANSGYCGLDSSGLVSASQLPSYVDDVLEYANLAAFPGTGATGKIYVAVDTGKVYRWSGSVYVEISPSPGSTDSVTEGSTNLYYTNTRADARITAAIGVTVASLTGTETLTSKTLTNPTVNNYTEGVVAIGTVTSASTLSLTNGTVQTATLTASTACTFTMPTVVAGKSFVLMLKQAATTGNGTATFTGVKWSGGTAPTVTAAAARMDILSFFADSVNWYGSFTQNFTP